LRAVGLGHEGRAFVRDHGVVAGDRVAADRVHRADRRLSVASGAASRSRRSLAGVMPARVSELTYERDCSLPATTALPRLASWLGGHGYDVVARSASELSLFHRAGPFAHRLSVTSDGRRVTFRFAAASFATDDALEAQRPTFEL